MLLHVETQCSCADTTIFYELLCACTHSQLIYPSVTMHKGHFQLSVIIGHHSAVELGCNQYAVEGGNVSAVEGQRCITFVSVILLHW